MIYSEVTKANDRISTSTPTTTTTTVAPMIPTIEIVGIIGGMIISLSLIPQVYKTYQSKSATNISYTYQIIYIVGCTLINIYAFYTRLWIIYVPCVLEQILIVMLTFMKIWYDGVGAGCGGGSGSGSWCDVFSNGESRHNGDELENN